MSSHHSAPGTAEAVAGPTDAERARTLFAEARTGTLATLAVDPAGVPFGSLVSQVADDLGRPVLCLSDMAEHTRNLAADPRASVMVNEVGTGDPLARGRVTLLGEIGRLTGDERAAVLALYRSAHPDAFYVDFADFHVYRLAVASVRYVGGFARMSWVDPAEYAAAMPDPLRAHRAGIVGHMNDDHADALVNFCRVFAGRPDTVSARMLDVDRYGFSVLAADAPDADGHTVRLSFDEPADTPLAVRSAMVALVHRARS